MKEIKLDIISDEALIAADAVFIPTNLRTRKDGRAIMGAGLAKQALRRWPKAEAVLGAHLSIRGEGVWQFAMEHGCRVFGFPTKYHWKGIADLGLIGDGCVIAKGLADFFHWQTAYIPPLGCGLGRLSKKQVYPILEDLLDERFTICTI